MKQNLLRVVSLAIVATFLLSACTTAETGKLTASGTFSANDTSIAPELSGKVTEVSVLEGESVKAGQTLFKIDAEVSQAQYDQAAATVSSAEAAVEASRAQAASAESQYQLALQGAHMQDMPTRKNAWINILPGDYREVWYFSETELIEAAQAASSRRSAAPALAPPAVSWWSRLRSALRTDGFLRPAFALLALVVVAQQWVIWQGHPEDEVRFRSVAPQIESPALVVRWAPATRMEDAQALLEGLSSGRQASVLPDGRWLVEVDDLDAARVRLSASRLVQSVEEP